MDLVNDGSLIIKSRAIISYALVGGIIGCNSLYSKCWLTFALLYILYSYITY